MKRQTGGEDCRDALSVINRVYGVYLTIDFWLFSHMPWGQKLWIKSVLTIWVSLQMLHTISYWDAIFRQQLHFVHTLFTHLWSSSSFFTALHSPNSLWSLKELGPVLSKNAITVNCKTAIQCNPMGQASASQASQPSSTVSLQWLR